MRPIWEYPVIVVVFGQPGCGHCDEFIPRFRVIAARWSSCVPAAVLSALDVPAFADRLRIEATPSVLVLRFGRVSGPIRGNMNDVEIEALFARVATGMECAI